MTRGERKPNKYGSQILDKDSLMHEGLSYDDVLLRPRKTNITNLDDVDTGTEVGGIKLDVPIMSAPMDTVTEADLAYEVSKNGGLGVIHRFMIPEEQAQQVTAVHDSGERVAAAVGLNDIDRLEALVAEEVDMIVFDIAHGHHEELLKDISSVSERDIPIMAGNVATEEGAIDLSEAGSDVVKVGIGPGSACTTRKVAGAGVPQLSAVSECSKVDADIVADGGIKTSGDMVKAIMAGADAVMLGGLFASKESAPNRGIFRGMASRAAAHDRCRRTGRDVNGEDRIEEGVEMTAGVDGTVEDLMNEFRGGLRSGVSYCGGSDLQSARLNAQFVKISGSTEYRNGAHYKS